ncbi:MAG: hypothetical protein ACXVPN_15660 [Bacteroidia bacterium]
MKKINFAVAGLLSVILTSCWYNHKWEELHPYGQLSGPPKPCDTSGVISFSVTVQPIITQNCGTTNNSCHMRNGGPGASDYTKFINIQNDCLSGTFMQRIDLPSSNSLHMPLNNQTVLDPCDTLKIRQWINQGCQNN